MGVGSTGFGFFFFFFVFRCKFFSLTETPEDYTIMLDEEGFKGSVRWLPRPPLPGWHCRHELCTFSACLSPAALQAWAVGGASPGL